MILVILIPLYVFTIVTLTESPIIAHLVSATMQFQMDGTPQILIAFLLIIMLLMVVIAIAEFKVIFEWQ